MDKLLRISEKDNVAVALTALDAGAALSVDGIDIVIASDVPAGHKVALCDITAEKNVIKYGFPIGCATEDIKKGGHVHVHNVRTLLSGELEYEYTDGSNILTMKKKL